ncbi:MAG TPA: indolepyruvate ferredoxin oxidoreductase, partial [Acidimicrobiaceae bacterium]|nr:indolepyruvate ferredoxin oxidoreductase [Acidimicrobiaceae bacterium]
MAVRMCGIGGTGVVTVSQLLGTAALLDGWESGGVDQIGLSQKAGPVVGDLRLSRGGRVATSRVGKRQADVLVAFDQLVAASPLGLEVCDPGRTVVVGSTSPTPTGAMITDPGVRMPSTAELSATLAAAGRPDAQHWADAEAVTKTLLGSAVTANVFVIGMAVQCGALPLSLASLREAIELNGVAVEANLAAFDWGRAQIAAPEKVAAALAATS